MPIQFLCAGCRQPIEVDDEFAGRPVTCPYCRKVVTTPSQTDPAVSAPAPQARSTEPQPGAAIPPMSPGPPPRTNVLSWLSLACIVLSGVFIVAGSAALKPIEQKIPPNSTPQQMQNIMRGEFKNHPGGFYAVVAGLCIFPVVGVIFAIVALIKRTPPRWPAIMALVLLGMFILLMFVAMLVQASAVSGRPSG